MRIVGIDPSLTATGIATPEQVTTLRPPNGMKGPERLAWIRERVVSHASNVGMDYMGLVVIEGYSYASAHGAHQLGELGGVLRVALWEAQIPYVEISPTQLKRYATGKGNVTKDAVLAAAIRKLGYEGSDHNQADAMWLRAIGVDHFAVLDGAMVDTNVQLDVLRKITWPDLKVPA